MEFTLNVHVHVQSVSTIFVCSQLKKKNVCIKKPFIIFGIISNSNTKYILTSLIDFKNDCKLNLNFFRYDQGNDAMKLANGIRNTNKIFKFCERIAPFNFNFAGSRFNQ